MVNTTKLGYVTFCTQNINEMMEHYTKVMGLSLIAKEKDGTVYLSTGIDHHNIILKPSSSEKGLKNCGLKIHTDESIEEVQQRLKNEGISSTVKTNLVPGIEKLIELKDNDGFQVHLYKEIETPNQGINNYGVAPNKLGHLARWTTDPQKTVNFYEKHLGFRVSDWMEDFFAFMRCNQDHHSLNFIKPDDSAQANQLHHVAFELRDWTHMKDTLDFLGEHNKPIVWGPLRHGIGHNIAVYHHDPDGNLIELFIELDVMNEELGYFEPKPWHRDVPQKPKVWKDSSLAISLWGVKPPEGMME